jgi:hypothetical protein
MWDPNTWGPDEHEHRIYADETLEHYAVVDAIDYSWCSQWLWSMHSRKKWERTGRFYLRRAVTVFNAPDGERYTSPIHGHVVRNRNRTVTTRFLHTEILLRMGAVQPTPEHIEGDHINRQWWDCRRNNLRWATRKEQVANSSYRDNLIKARASRWR